MYTSMMIIETDTSQIDFDKFSGSDGIQTQDQNFAFVVIVTGTKYGGMGGGGYLIRSYHSVFAVYHYLTFLLNMLIQIKADFL